MRCHTTRAIFAQCRALSSNGHGASRNRARHCSPRLHIACDFIQGGRTGHACPVSRRRCTPELRMNHPHGRQRAQGRPGAGRTHGPPAAKKAGGSHHRLGRDTRPSLRNGFNGLLRALPGDRAFLPPSPRGSYPGNLASASGCQDHTTSPSAIVSFVRATCALTPSHPALNVRDDREAPLMRARDRRSKTYNSEKRKLNLATGKWMTRIALKSLAKFVFLRKATPAAESRTHHMTAGELACRANQFNVVCGWCLRS